MELKAPMPWFGGKATVTKEVWARFGAVRNYVEPFYGSGAVHLARPVPFEGPETVNDLDGLVANFWRAVQAAPDVVARHADWPVNENDLHARHAWLVGRKESLQARLEGDPDFFDAKVAGWWCWGVCCWIGAGWCSDNGPWRVVEGEGGVPVLANVGGIGAGQRRQLVHLGDAGQGVHRKLVHLGDAGQGGEGIYAWMAALSDRLRRVRVCCGDWSRVCGPTPTVKLGLTAVFLDPPYGGDAGRDESLYRTESLTVAAAVRRWCAENGGDPDLRIALCGYAGEGHEGLEGLGWRAHRWKGRGGYGSQGEGRGRENAGREVVWFSPHCLFERGLFDG